MKLLIVLIASAQRGRRESPSQTCSLSFYSFLGYVKIPTQTPAVVKCCIIEVHGIWPPCLWRTPCSTFTAH